MIPTIHKKSTVLVVGAAPIVKPQPVILKAQDYRYVGNLDQHKLRNGVLARMQRASVKFSDS